MPACLVALTLAIVAPAGAQTATDAAAALDLCEAAVRAGSPAPLAGLTETGRFPSAHGQLDIDLVPPGGAGSMMWTAAAVVYAGHAGDAGLTRSCWLRVKYTSPAQRDAALAAMGAWLDGTLARGFAADDGKSLRRTRDCAPRRPIFATLQDRDWMSEVTAIVADAGPAGPVCTP